MQVSMPSASTSTLSRPSAVDVVLVPLDEGAVLHGRVADRHDLDEGPARQHEAADVLGEVAREADQLLGELEHRRSRGSPGSSPARARAPRAPHLLPNAAPDHAGEAATVSSDRPIALPTSRTAERAR